MESNLAQINVIRCKSIIMQWVYNVYLYLLFKKSNCQTLNLSLFIFHALSPLYCINSLGPNFGVFESLHKEKHINSTRKTVQSATQRFFHRKPAQFFENSTKLCEIYILISFRQRKHKTTTYNRSFFLRTTRTWNSLPEHLRLINLSFIQFKKGIFAYYLTALRSCYNVDDSRTWKTVCVKCNTCRSLIRPLTCC
jgi:hypothetical protein